VSDVVQPALFATRGEARDAAEAVLKEGGSALDAVIAGYFASCGATSWAVFAPIIVGFGGSGDGIKFIDGRVRQAGKSSEKPLRYKSLQQTPPLARLAVPCGLQAISIAFALEGTAKRSALMEFGLKHAKQAQCPHRLQFLKEVKSTAHLAMQSRKLWDEIHERARRVDGGLFSEEDLDTSSPEVISSPTKFLEQKCWVTPSPWMETEIPEGAEPSQRHLVMAGDFRGQVAVLQYDEPKEVYPLYGGDLELPVMGIPNIKGVPRFKPGTTIPLRNSVSFVEQPGGAMGVFAASVPIPRSSYERALPAISSTTFVPQATKPAASEQALYAIYRFANNPVQMKAQRLPLV
jgi:hypothetical protein